MKLVKKPTHEYKPGEIVSVTSPDGASSVIGVVAGNDKHKGFQYAYFDRAGLPVAETIEKARQVRSRVNLVQDAGDREIRVPDIVPFGTLKLYDTIYEFHRSPKSEGVLRGRIVDQFGVDLAVIDADEVKHHVTVWDLAREVRFTEDPILKHFSARVAARKKKAVKRQGFVLLAESEPCGNCRIDNTGRERISPLHDDNAKKARIYRSVCELFETTFQDLLSSYGLRCAYPGHLYKFILINYWVMRNQTLEEGLSDLSGRFGGEEIPVDFYLETTDTVEIGA